MAPFDLGAVLLDIVEEGGGGRMFVLGEELGFWPGDFGFLAKGVKSSLAG
jgi:hypothetical protein